MQSAVMQSAKTFGGELGSDFEKKTFFVNWKTLDIEIPRVKTSQSKYSLLFIITAHWTFINFKLFKYFYIKNSKILPVIFKK